jgi:prepilin-type processing-associated H-X9-DG protein
MIRGASRFVTLLEDPAEYAFRKDKRWPGYHGELSKHNFGFLDGHVEYRYIDTREDFGPDWTVVDETPLEE